MPLFLRSLHPSERMEQPYFIQPARTGSRDLSILALSSSSFVVRMSLYDTPVHPSQGPTAAMAFTIFFHRSTRRMLKERLHSITVRAISMSASLCLSLRKDKGPETPPTDLGREVCLNCFGGRSLPLADDILLFLEEAPPEEATGLAPPEEAAGVGAPTSNRNIGRGLFFGILIIFDVRLNNLLRCPCGATTSARLQREIFCTNLRVDGVGDVWAWTGTLAMPCQVHKKTVRRGCHCLGTIKTLPPTHILLGFDLFKPSTMLCEGFMKRGRHDGESRLESLTVKT